MVQTFEQQITALQIDLTRALIDEFKIQGHSLTGKFESEIETIVKNNFAATSIEWWFLPHMVYLEKGVTASKIPFSGTAKRGKGTGKKSQFIEGLVRYAELRFSLSGKAALGAAFAIARTQKAMNNSPFGMPTKGALKFSQSGERIGFIDTTLEKNKDYIETTITSLFEQSYDLFLIDVIKKYNAKMNE